MGRTGARRSLSGSEAVLRLRALRSSGDFDDYWQFHLAKEYERTHASRYAEGAVPNPLPPLRPHLKPRQVIGIASVERARKEPHPGAVNRCTQRICSDPLTRQYLSQRHQSWGLPVRWPLHYRA